MTINLAQWRRNAARRRNRALQRARRLQQQLEDARGVDVPLITTRLRRAVAMARTAHREWRFLNRSLRQQDELKKVQAQLQRLHDERDSIPPFDPGVCEAPDEHAHRVRGWNTLTS